MKKALKRLENVGGPLSPDQFDSVMAQYAGTQPMPGGSTGPVRLPRRSPGSLEAKTRKAPGG